MPDRLSTEPTSTADRAAGLGPDGPDDEEPSDTFSVGLSTVRATVTLPDGVTDADLVALVRTILNRKK